jgi:hypothetical protein
LAAFAVGLIPDYAFERYFYLYKSETLLCRNAIAEVEQVSKFQGFNVSKSDHLRVRNVVWAGTPNFETLKL